jgi:hypothetical protein
VPFFDQKHFKRHWGLSDLSQDARIFFCQRNQLILVLIRDNSAVYLEFRGKQVDYSFKLELNKVWGTNPKTWNFFDSFTQRGSPRLKLKWTENWVD